MAFPLITDKLTQDPPSQPARREKRALMGFAALALFLLHFDAIQAESTVRIQSNPFTLPREAILWGLVLMVAYFLVAFLVYALSDLLNLVAAVFP